jgi:endo-1,4-beta-D-glucanase Y
MLQMEYERWKNAFVQECPDGSAVVVKDGGQVVSEGIGYGLLISVNMDDQALFDGLWQFYGDHLDENGLMNWSVGVCDAPGNNMAHAAADAELDTLMALLQAQAAWGGSYAQDAATLASAVLAYEVEDCDGRLTLKPGDVWGGCSDMTGETRINPSYFAPGYYRAFAKAFAADADQWSTLLEGSYELLAPMQTRLDGLFPDWAGADGTDWYGSSYGYDACRVPWRLAVDFAWSGEPRAQSALETAAAWVAQNGGIPAANMPNNSAFQGGFALASISDSASFDASVAAWLSAGGDDSPYFQGTLRLLYLLVAGGRFPSTL